MDVLDEVLRQLRSTKEPFSAIARECGVSQRWLYRLVNGDYRDPGVRKIHRLHRFFTERAATMSDKGKAA